MRLSAWFKFSEEFGFKYQTPARIGEIQTLSARANRAQCFSRFNDENNNDYDLRIWELAV